MNNINTLRKTVAKVLALAIKEVFPDAKLIDAKETLNGFLADFTLNKRVPSNLLELLHLRMLSIINAKTEIEELSMMVFSAKNYFAHLNLDFYKTDLKDQDIIELIKINDFLDFGEAPFLKNTKDIKFFKLLSFSKLLNNTIRIEGTAFFDKDSFKEACKRINRSSKLSYETLGKKLLFFSRIDGSWLWFPKGEILKGLILNFYNKELLKQKFHFVFSNKDMSSYAKIFGHTKVNKLVEEGIEYIFLPKREDFENSLQFIVKLLTTFNLKYKIVEKREEALFFLEDLSGRLYEGPFLKFLLLDKENLLYISCSDTKEKKVLKRSSIGDINYFTALVLESCGGVLPLFLAPEQLRILVVDNSLKDYAESIKKAFEQKGFRVGIDNFRNGVKIATRENIPYVLIIGSKEKESGQIRFRKLGCNYFEIAEKEIFIKKLQGEMEIFEN